MAVYDRVRVSYGRALDDTLMHDDRLYIRSALDVSLRIMHMESCAGTQHPVAALCHPYAIIGDSLTGGPLRGG